MKTPVAVILLLSLLLQAVPRVASQPVPTACSMDCCAALPVAEHCGCVNAPTEGSSSIPSLPAPAQGRDSLPQPASTDGTGGREMRLRSPQATYKTLSALAKAPAAQPQVALTVLFCAFLT